MLQICVSLGDISYPFCNVLYTIVLYFTSSFDTMLHCTKIYIRVRYCIVLYSCCLSPRNIAYVYSYIIIYQI